MRTCLVGKLSDAAALRVLSHARFRMTNGPIAGLRLPTVISELHDSGGALVTFRNKSVRVPALGYDLDGKAIVTSRVLDISRVAILDRLGRWNGDPARALYANYYDQQRWIRFESTDMESLCLR